MAILVAVSFFGASYVFESELAQSFCLGAYSTGLAGAVALFGYSKLARVAEAWNGRWSAPRAASPASAAPVAVTVAGRDPAEQRPGWVSAVQSPNESAVLNGVALIAVITAALLLVGTHLAQNEFVQSFLLGAFATGLAGSITLLGYNRLVRVTEQRRLDRALQEYEARFSRRIEHINDMVTVLDPDGLIRFEAPSVRKVLGHEPETLENTLLSALVHPEDRAAVASLFEQAIQAPGLPMALVYRARHRDGSWRVLETIAQCVETAEGKEIISTARDVTERQRMEDALVTSEQRFRDFAETAADYFWETDAEFRFTYVSDNFEDKTGIPARSAIGSTPQATFATDQDDTGRWQQHLEDLAAARPYSDFEIRTHLPSGVVRVLRDSGKPVFDAAGRCLGYRGATRNVTEAHSLSEKISYQATHDALTGFINRRTFEERVQRVIDSARRDGSHHVLCYLDLDQFKVINDTCGHVAGDAVLRQLATLLLERVRTRDTLARLGGDEFAIIMEHCSLEQGKAVAEKVRAAVGGYPFSWSEAQFKLGVSIGVVPIDEGSADGPETLGAADSACYIAKEQGRNRIHVSQSGDLHLAKRSGEMQWVSRIHRALDDDQFRLYFQPIVVLQDNPALARRDEHVEVLLRYMAENGEVVLPADFLPAAERYGIAANIDEWVIRRTMAWLASHPEHLARLRTCSINLSGHSLGTDGFAEFIAAELQRSGVPAHKICFEITETSAVEQLANAARFMATLKALGCRLALDDFGRGVSSFAHLRELPVDVLKIDGLFVKQIATDPIDHAMVRSINEIGHLMGIQTVAEYAQSPEIIAALREMGVDYAQGSAICAPRPLDEMAAGTGDGEEQLA